MLAAAKLPVLAEQGNSLPWSSLGKLAIRIGSPVRTEKMLAITTPGKD